MYNNILASLDCFLCCKKFTSKSYQNESNQNQSLIHGSNNGSGKNVDQQGRTPYYTVRRVSRVAGTISLEDINDELGSDSNLNDNNSQKGPKIILSKNKDINDSGLWECPSESSLADENNKSSMEVIKTSPEKTKRWQKALQNQFRQRIHKSASPSSLAASTPDLTLLRASESPPRLAADTGANTKARTGSLEAMNASQWMKSQSMLDVTITSAASTNSARDFGLDPDLYPAPERGTASPKPEEARATPHGREDRFMEMSHGTVYFTVTYASGKLHVHVSHLEELPVKGEVRKYPVTLRLTILPQEKGHHMKTTKTARDSKSPKFNEDFDFTLANPVGHTLRVSACDAGAHGGKYDAVGHALLALDEITQLTQPKSFRLKLYKQSEPPNGNSGLLQATLSYDQREQKLSLLAMQCRGLQLAQSSKSSRAPDKYTTYIKASLYCKGQKVKSKKSNVIINEKDPFYNHSFHFSVSSETMSECCLVVSAMLKSRLKADTLIGRVILGPNFYADGTNMTPWGRVVLGQQTASHWYKLYI